MRNRKRDPAPPPGGLGQFVACAVLMAPFLGIGAYLHWRILEMEAWPQAQAEILESRIKLVSGIGTRHGSSITYKPIIRYRYQVDGRSYTGHRVGSLTLSSGLKDKEREAIERHPVGSRALVHYNPNRPRESVLETRLWIGLAYYSYAIGGLISIISLWRLVKRMRR